MIFRLLNKGELRQGRGHNVFVIIINLEKMGTKDLVHENVKTLFMNGMASHVKMSTFLEDWLNGEIVVYRIEYNRIENYIVGTT